MKVFNLGLVCLALLCLSSDALAQRGGGQPRPPGAGQGDRNAMNQRGVNRQSQGFQNQAAANLNSGQGMRSPQQIAQLLVVRFDADGSGELNQTELQAGLVAVLQMITDNRTGLTNQFGPNSAVQNQIGQQAGLANQGNSLESRGIRSPPNRPAQGGRRRTR